MNGNLPAVVRAMILASLPLCALLVGCGGGSDDPTATESPSQVASPSSTGALRAYFARLDEAQLGHSARIEAFTPSSDYVADNLFTLASIEQMLSEIESIQAPSEARKPQRQLVDAFRGYISEMRHAFNQLEAGTTSAPDQTSAYKRDFDAGCASLAAIAAENAIESDFFCVADSELRIPNR